MKRARDVVCECIRKAHDRTHDRRCDRRTAALEARDAEHAARLATLVDDLRAICNRAHKRDGGPSTESRVLSLLDAFDAESSGPAIPDGTVK